MQGWGSENTCQMRFEVNLTLAHAACCRRSQDRAAKTPFAPPERENHSNKSLVDSVFSLPPTHKEPDKEGAGRLDYFPSTGTPVRIHVKIGGGAKKSPSKTDFEGSNPRLRTKILGVPSPFFPGALLFRIKHPEKTAGF